MFDENQLVEIKWSNKTRKFYESKGYIFTNYGDLFLVKAKDLTPNAKTKVEVVCDFCGKLYHPVYMNFNKRTDKSVDSCNECKVHKQWAKTRNNRAREKFDILRKICIDNDYELITNESEFVDIFTPIRYICKKHGIQEQTLDNMIHGHKCYFCSYEERGLNCRHSIEYIKNTIEGYNNNILLNPNDYIGSNVRNLEIKCGSCGEKYITSFSDYINNMQIRCKSCAQSESVGEMRIRVFLENNKIYFIREKTFKDCVDKKRLPFDFYLPKYNLIIEFDGQHHFYETGFGNYELTKKHDEIKNKYCKENHINLLRIPYFDGNKIEEILKKELNL